MKLIIIFLLNFFPSVLANEISINCYSYLTELVRSSNFPFGDIPKEKNHLLIDTDENDIILAQVNYNKDEFGISYDTDRTAINGWIKYYMESQRLYDVSAYIDPDNSVELFFNKSYADLFKQCRTMNQMD